MEYIDNKIKYTFNEISVNAFRMPQYNNECHMGIVEVHGGKVPISLKRIKELNGEEILPGDDEKLIFVKRKTPIRRNEPFICDKELGWWIPVLVKDIIDEFKLVHKHSDIKVIKIMIKEILLCQSSQQEQ